MSTEERLRGRLQERLSAVRTRFREGFPLSSSRSSSSAQRVGGGALVREVMGRAERLTTRIAERKPGLIPMVKEFRPGERIKSILAPSVVDGDELSVESDTADYATRGDMSVII